MHISYFKKTFISFLLTSYIFYIYCFPNCLGKQYTKKQSTNLTHIQSKNYLVLDKNSNNVLLEKNGYDKVPMASTTKIMTCILAIEHGNLDDIVTISKNATNINGSKLKLTTNSKIKLKDLLYGLMLRSGNDAAIAVAEHISGSVDNFLILMNQKAEKLNLYNTHFTSPHGLDNENHYTTCYELALLANYALSNSTFKKIVSTYSTTITINNTSQTINNTNNLLNVDKNFYGVKTGFTFNAGRCIVSAYKKNNLDVIIVTLNSNTNNQRTTDNIILKNYILENYNSVYLKDQIYESFHNFLSTNKEIYIKSIPSSKISLSEEFNSINYFLIKKENLISFKINIIPVLSFKQFSGEKIGTFNIYENDSLIKTIDIILSSEPKKLDYNFYFYFLIKNII